MNAASGDGDPPSDAGGEVPAAIATALADDEEIVGSWEATGVRWADEWDADAGSTPFVATDRRIVFAADGGTTSIGYGRVRAVETAPASGGPDVSTAILGCGGVCLLAGLVVATDDVSNGAVLVVLSVALLAAGSVTGDAADRATITVVIGNERQRLAFRAEESVGDELAALAGARG